MNRPASSDDQSYYQSSGVERKIHRRGEKFTFSDKNLKIALSFTKIAGETKIFKLELWVKRRSVMNPLAT